VKGFLPVLLLCAVFLLMGVSMSASAQAYCSWEGCGAGWVRASTVGYLSEDSLWVDNRPYPGSHLFDEGTYGYDYWPWSWWGMASLYETTDGAKWPDYTARFFVQFDSQPITVAIRSRFGDAPPFDTGEIYLPSSSSNGWYVHIGSSAAPGQLCGDYYGIVHPDPQSIDMWTGAIDVNDINASCDIDGPLDTFYFDYYQYTDPVECPELIYQICDILEYRSERHVVGR
jgi:hypothetical protein